MCNQHTVSKINLPHAVLHRLDCLPHIDTRHRHQRHIRKLQPAVFPLHNKSSFHLKPLPALQLPHRLLIFFYHTASAIPMQAGHSSLRKLRLRSPIFSFAAQKGLRTPASLSHAPEQQVFRVCPKTRQQIAVPFGNCFCPAHFNFAAQKGLRTPASLSHAPEQQVFRGCFYYQATDRSFLRKLLLLLFLTPLNSKCSGAASTTRQQLRRSALPSA